MNLNKEYSNVKIFIIKNLQIVYPTMICCPSLLTTFCLSLFATRTPSEQASDISHSEKNMDLQYTLKSNRMVEELRNDIKHSLINLKAELKAISLHMINMMNLKLDAIHF